MDKRRSSILKPKKERNPFAEVDFTTTAAQAADTDRFSKKVRFSSNFVKPFTTENDNNTVWDNTYEEVIDNMTESSQESNMGISQPLKEITNINEDDLVGKEKSILTTTQTNVNETAKIPQVKYATKSSVITMDGAKGDSRKTINFNPKDSIADMEISLEMSLDKPSGSNFNKTLILQEDFELTQTSLLKDSINNSAENDSVDFILGKGNVLIPVKTKRKSKKNKTSGKNKLEVQKKSNDVQGNETGKLKATKKSEIVNAESSDKSNKETRKTIVFNPDDEGADMEVTKVDLCVTENTKSQNKSKKKGLKKSIAGVERNKEMMQNLEIISTENNVQTTRKTILFNPTNDEANMEMTLQAPSATAEPSFHGESLLNKMKSLRKTIITAENGGTTDDTNLLLKRSVKKNPSRKTILFDPNNQDGNMEISLQGPDTVEEIFNTKESYKQETLKKTVVCTSDVAEINKGLKNVEIVISEENVNQMVQTSRKTILFNPNNDEANMEMSLQVPVSSELTCIGETLNCDQNLLGNRENLAKKVDGLQNIAVSNLGAATTNNKRKNLQTVNSEESMKKMAQTCRKTILFNPNNEEADMEMSVQTPVSAESTFVGEPINCKQNQGDLSKKVDSVKKTIASNLKPVFSEECMKKMPQASRRTILFNPNNEDADMDMSVQTPVNAESTVVGETNQNLMAGGEKFIGNIVSNSDVTEPNKEFKNVNCISSVESSKKMSQTSRKTILFNPNNDEGNMEMSMQAPVSAETTCVGDTFNCKQNLIPKTENLLNKETNNLDNMKKMTKTSRKTILFNPANEEANMEMTLQDPFEPEKSAISTNTLLLQKDEINLLANHCPQEMIKARESSRKTIHFNSAENDGDMEMSEDASGFEQKKSAVKSRKTIVFNPTNEDADMEITLHVPFDPEMIKLPNKKSESNLVAESPVERTCNVSKGKGSSRKTIVFNPDEVGADMEMTIASPNSMGNCKTIKTIPFNPEDADNVTKGKGSSRKTIVFNPDEVGADMEMTIASPSSSGNCKTMKTIPFNPREAGIKITMLPLKDDEKNLLENVESLEKPTKLTKSNATSRKTIVFNPSEDDANMEITLNAQNSPHNLNQQETVVPKPEEKFANSKLVISEPTSQYSTPNNIQMEKSQCLSSRKTMNRTTMDFNFENKKIFHSTGVDFGDRTGDEDSDEPEQVSIAQYDQNEVEECEIDKKEKDPNFQNRNNDRAKAKLVIYQDEEDKIKTENLEKEKKLKSLPPFNMKCKNLFEQDFLQKKAFHKVGNEMKGKTGDSPVKSPTESSPKVFVDTVPGENLTEVPDSFTEDGKSNVFDYEHQCNENATQYLTKGNISALPDVTVGFGMQPRTFCRIRSTFSPSTDDTQHLINYKLKDEKYQKSDFSKIISGEMQVDNQTLSPLCFSTNLTSSFSDTAEIANILQKSLDKTHIKPKGNKQIEEIENTFEEEIATPRKEKLVEEIVHELEDDIDLSRKQDEELMLTIRREQTVLNISDESIGLMNSPQITITSEESSIDFRSLNAKELLLHIIRDEEDLKNDSSIQQLADDLLRIDKKIVDMDDTNRFIKAHNEYVERFQREIDGIVSNQEKTDVKHLVFEETPKSLQEKVEQYIQKYDTMSGLKFLSSVECVFETLHGTIKIKVSMNICGVVLSFNPVPLIVKDDSEPSAMLIHSLLLEKLQPGVIELSVGKPFTIYTLLDYVDTTMCVFDKLDDEFSDLEDRGLQMDYNYRVTLPIVDMKLSVSWRIYIDFSNIKVTKDGVSCEAVVGNINETEIKNLVPPEGKRGLQGLISYVHNVLDYVKVKRSRKEDERKGRF